ncbi:hypothetical protein [Vibrio mediterranei]|uniref:hypothetical protein n=1 Tax=Vibrio mediterranei TaxID=689 RepID=UPI00148E1B1D|nr:hypothetical protein [Vibrio mediterranei]NOH31559.1 hypothetical protein [Vibrio mediterranei]
MDLNKPRSFIVKATMTTELECKGEVTLLTLIDHKLLNERDVENEGAIQSALTNYSKYLDGGEFVEKEGFSGSWDIDDVRFYTDS